ncbi:hypothetical protein ACHAXH_002835, partial [Discostella pseudostelligera]
MDSEIQITEMKRPQHSDRGPGDAAVSDFSIFKNSNSDSSHNQQPKQRRQHRLVQPHEIPLYIQRSHFQFDDIIYFFTNTEPARFHFPKPPKLQQHNLSDDAWAALQLRVDHVARDILDPHRYYAAALGVGLMMTIVFYAVRPGYDRNTIHATSKNRNGEGGDANVDDDELYDDYIQDDLWERNHSMDDVVLAELNYLNSNLDTSLLLWRISLIGSLMILFGCVIFLVVLMERRNCVIDGKIRVAIDEIRSRFEDEGIGVEYRTYSSHPPPNSNGMIGKLCSWGKYIRPTRVVVFYYLDDIPGGSSSRSLTGTGLGGVGGGEQQHPQHRTKKTSSFFSEDYQRR